MISHHSIHRRRYLCFRHHRIPTRAKTIMSAILQAQGNVRRFSTQTRVLHPQERINLQSLFHDIIAASCGSRSAQKYRKNKLSSYNIFAPQQVHFYLGAASLSSSTHHSPCSHSPSLAPLPAYTCCPSQ